MHHDILLISTIAVALVYAAVLGLLAVRLRPPPLASYLLAGVLVGPFTPGFVADTTLAPQLAEIGVILLMFGVGMHFSLGDLLAVRAVAVPGALVQIAVATLMGFGPAQWWAGRRAGGWCSGWRCPSPAPSSCCARSKRGACSTRKAAASPSVGSSSRTW